MFYESKIQLYLRFGYRRQLQLRIRNSNKNNANPHDPRFSGDYVITKVRHQVTGDSYKMVLECAKDSVATGYQSPSIGLSLHGDGIHQTNQSFSIEEIDSDIGY